MKKFLVAVALLACAGGVAFAGPNAGGTLFVHDANLVYTVDTASYCGLGTPPSSCESADTQIDGAVDPATAAVFKVYAAFCPQSSPRLKAMTFGIYYDQAVNLVAFGPCIGDQNNGALEIQGPGWPGNNTGTAIVFQFTQTTTMVEAYWFAGYLYYTDPTGRFSLGPHPDPVLGGKFADDSVPSLEDNIAGYGSLGFGTPGQTACPDPEFCNPSQQGACCIDPDGDGVPNVCIIASQPVCVDQGGIYQGDGTTCGPNNEPCPQPELRGACCTDPDGDGIPNVCTIETAAGCEGLGGIYQGDNSTCEPDNPCPQPPNPVREGTWGQIKANYR